MTGFEIACQGPNPDTDEVSFINGLNQAMTAVLCLAWVIIYYSMMNGSEQAGAKLYFVAMCPYVILTIFLGMGLRSG